MKAKDFIITFIIFFLMPLIVCAQNPMSIQVLDKTTNGPLPYAHILLKGKNKGAISNAEGTFEIKYSKNDTLKISYLSYQTLEISSAELLETQKCYLTPLVNKLAEVTVYPKEDYLLSLMVKARKKLVYSGDSNGKAYFSLETSTNNTPVELMECYYNIVLNNNKIEDVALKAGRIGMADDDGAFFSSLSTSSAISSYDLLRVSSAEFPLNPLQLSRARIRNIYDYELLSYKSGVYEISFTAKSKKKKYFYATVWLDEENERILKTTIAQEALDLHPFKGIDTSHTLSELNFLASYSFSEEPTSRIEEISFSYAFDYNDSRRTKRMESNGVFLFYDYETSFNLPKYPFNNSIRSDYQKIVFQPYNSEFWASNKLLQTSKKKELYKQFFKDNGVLLNFDQLSEYHENFENSIVEWSEDRIFSADLKALKEDEFGVLGFGDLSKDRHEFSGKYDPRAEIYLDKVEVNGEIHYFTKTLINLKESSYGFPIHENSACILNLYYDLVEIGRREMLRELESKEWTLAQSDSIYDNRMLQLKGQLNVFFKHVERAENKRAVNYYIALVKKSLGVDNNLLLVRDEFMNPNEGENALVYELLNYGHELSKRRKYNESLKIMLKAKGLKGGGYSWFNYICGLNYFSLSYYHYACDFLRNTDGLVQRLKPSIYSTCQ